MEVIKRKIAALKDDLENKEELISELQNALKNEKLEREKAENEASSFERKVSNLFVPRLPGTGTEIQPYASQERLVRCSQSPDMSLKTVLDPTFGRKS